MTEVSSRRVIWQRTNAWRPVFAHHGTLLAFAEATSNANDIVLLDLATQKEKRIATTWKSTHWIEFTSDDQRVFDSRLAPPEGGRALGTSIMT